MHKNFIAFPQDFDLPNDSNLCVALIRNKTIPYHPHYPCKIETEGYLNIKMTLGVTLTPLTDIDWTVQLRQNLVVLSPVIKLHKKPLLAIENVY
jgi:hypothetical protein